MIKQLALGAALFAGSISLSSAATIDFEDLTESQPGDSFQTLVSGGVTFTAVRGGGSTANDILGVFNTVCNGPGQPTCTGENGDAGDDGDLSFPNGEYGLVLVINDQTPVASFGTDDEENGGTIDVAFGTNVFVDDLVFLDLGDPASGSLELFDDGVSQGIFNLVGLGNNTAATTSIGGVLADQIVISFETSAALAEVNFTPVPVPAALPLMLSGLLGGLIFGRKKAKSA